MHALLAGMCAWQGENIACAQYMNEKNKGDNWTTPSPPSPSYSLLFFSSLDVQLFLVSLPRLCASFLECFLEDNTELTRNAFNNLSVCLSFSFSSHPCVLLLFKARIMNVPLYWIGGCGSRSCTSTGGNRKRCNQEQRLTYPSGGSSDGLGLALPLPGLS